ncbi:multifunctional CCA addition/repair protein [Vibrio salinus]|uniref:multifunctional CCA addition/repair protein n=1 Tax=Vibrio salinus TaxID=2899784 RepID=UPI001E4E21E4|nr:multifunctional CCA addition/repair protein [Vibrio salinus]MCE0493403.1 multifunctional CCA addition/repair protein [Vibrio salinus]
MKIYLVGGAVRDKLLKIDSDDRDWVVVGSTPEEMMKQGFTPVGKDFPVFLHPTTQEEHALARTEKKTGSGYTGFECYFSEEVTLEEDLRRRDLTINAMALDESGMVIDPYGGQRDLEHKRLRHVSEAFSEDPLRVLRVARFAAKLAHLGFRVAEETMQLMSHITESGELEHLTAERVWLEWHKSLTTPSPHIFFNVLRDCGALAVLLPELNNLFGVPQPEKWHPEIDTGIHTLMVLKQAAQLSPCPQIRFAATVHDLGKGITPQNEWPSHKKHCHNGLALINQVCDRFKLPNDYRELALIVCEQHSNVHRAMELRSDTFVRIFAKIDVWRKPERLNALLTCCHADHTGRKGSEMKPYPQKAIFEQAYAAAAAVNAQDVIALGFKGKEIREQLDKLRAHQIKMELNLTH